MKQSLTATLLPFFLFLSVCAGAQGGPVQHKIDPVFQRLLAQQEKTGSANAKRKPGGIKKRKGTATRPAKFPCIVYTADAQAVKESGIVVNAVYPTFLTAEATLAQILAMARMRTVRYVETSSYDKPQQLP